MFSMEQKKEFVLKSKIRAIIENLKIDTEMPKGEKINEQSKIYVYLCKVIEFIGSYSI